MYLIVLRGTVKSSSWWFLHNKIVSPQFWRAKPFFFNSVYFTFCSSFKSNTFLTVNIINKISRCIKSYETFPSESTPRSASSRICSASSAVEWTNVPLQTNRISVSNFSEVSMFPKEQRKRANRAATKATCRKNRVLLAAPHVTPEEALLIHLTAETIRSQSEDSVEACVCVSACVCTSMNSLFIIRYSDQRVS